MVWLKHKNNYKFMKISKIVFISSLFVFICVLPLVASADTLSQKMSGKILLQVEESGEGWYVDPDTQKRAYLGRPADAFRIMRELGLGVAHEQLQEYLDSQFPSNLAGKILLDVEKNGEAYYVDPDTLEGYFLGRPKDAFQVMRERGLGISNQDIEKVSVHKKYKESKKEQSKEAEVNSNNTSKYDLSFEVNPPSGQAPLTIDFDASSSSIADGTIKSYEWNFEDGSTKTGQTVSHIFSSGGDYTVKLTIESSKGIVETKQKTISVSPRLDQTPNAKFTVTPMKGEAPLEVSFDASKSNDPNGSIVSYSWKIGGNPSVTMPMSPQYVEAKGKKVNNFSFNGPGEQIVELIVTNDKGETDSKKKIIEVLPQNRKPIADFTAEPMSGEAPLEVSFDASNSSDPDGSISSYEWSLGGTKKTGKNISHTFSEVGHHSVSLTIEDEEGADDSKSKTISVLYTSN